MSRFLSNIKIVSDPITLNVAIKRINERSSETKGRLKKMIRFLKNNLRRDYEIIWDKKGDVTTIELQEERLGKYNLLGSDFFG